MMSNGILQKHIDFLHTSSASHRIQSQKKAVKLVFEKIKALKNIDSAVADDGLYHKLNQLLSEASTIFCLTPVQKEIYYVDSGTAFVPTGLKNVLLKIKARFVVRPGSLDDLQKFVQFAFQHKIKYTLRGAGTWPFGGSIPFNHEIILDLSQLDFFDLDSDHQQVAVGAGVILADLRTFLKERGFCLMQDITNPHSGTIGGWIATGGLGIGAFKYGHIKNSVLAVRLLRPNGEWQTVLPSDPAFSCIFGSEGQIGIIAGAVLQVKKQTYVIKPYALSFESTDAIVRFVKLISEWKLTPNSIIYFDPNYLTAISEVEKSKLNSELLEAIDSGDALRITRLRQELDIIENYADLKHTLVLEFDSKEDYQKALKYPFFAFSSERRRYQDIVYSSLSTVMAHHLWEHRYQPVAMKPLGPSMLVSEVILPIKNFSPFLDFLQSAITAWTGNPVKTEGHILNENEILLQTIILADTQTLRHKLYLGFVPFMTQTAIYFGGRPYGYGIWNLPFLQGASRNGQAEFLQELIQIKNQTDPHALINQAKFINKTGRRWTLRVFKKATPFFLHTTVKLLHAGKKNGQGRIILPVGRLLWKGSRVILPKVIPPRLHATRPPISEINIACAECDSCERVCPTSDVFGLLGIATPISRRKTANRLVAGKKISTEEALGFLICTRCDNCSRICPTHIPLTKMFDLVEQEKTFQNFLGLSEDQKKEFIDRAWEIMKESPLYVEHTKAELKESRSHLEHGLRILYTRGFAYARLYIDPETCIRCGMCAHENACTYGARDGHPRQIPYLLDENCALCNACINYCPQNKAIQTERKYISKLIENAVDLDEKKFWENQKKFLRDTTIIQRSPDLTDMADIYVTEDILMEIDKEASTGQIPVSGMGQGDRHMSIGFGAERFSHFHIVGPAQNRLHEGDPDEELSVTLGKRHRYCRFDQEGNLHNPPFPTVKLRSPIFYNAIPLDSNGLVELAFIKVAEKQRTLVFMEFNRFLEYYEYFREAGKYDHLPTVIVPRIDKEIIDHLQVHPRISRDLLTDLWQMPMFEIEYHDELDRTIKFVADSVSALNGSSTLFCGFLEISEHDIIGGMEVLPHIQEKINKFLEVGVDVLHIHGLRNKDNYFVTSQAVRAVHHYLLASGRRHLVSLIASGGIRLASDSQKTVQRGAEATLIDFAALLSLDPYAYRAIIEQKTTTEKLMSLDLEWAIKRLTNQMESRKIQILEVLGAAGFKDIKKTVGEEGRLIDFYQLEEQIQKNIFEKDDKIELYYKYNQELIQTEPVSSEASPTYSSLKSRVRNLRSPHNFYELGEINQTVYNRDHVWPGALIETIGRMAEGNPETFYLKNLKSTGLLGDGFDVMKILYQRDPDRIPVEELDKVKTSLLLDKDLVLQAPWMLGGKSVGSIGLDTWLAHVITARELGIQYDTGEGGYPTCFFLNRKGEPIFFTEQEMQLMKPFFNHNRHYTIREIKETLIAHQIDKVKYPHIYQILDHYPDLQSFLFYVVVDKDDEAFVSTEMKTGLFGVTKQTIKKTRRVVIAYSQGAKMGIGGHILAQKVNKLVSYLRGIQGLEYLHKEKLQNLLSVIERIETDPHHALHPVAKTSYPNLIKAHDDQLIFPELKQSLWEIQQRAYELNREGKLDPIEFEHILRLCEEVIGYSYTSIISPFPFHNCYSIEDVKAFIDIVRMINPRAVISVKVSPSVDIEFIAAGLARIAKDNTEEILREKVKEIQDHTLELSTVLSDYARQYGMKVEIWLDGPRGGTGASPNIIKGQMGMHIEYAIPLIHDRLVRDGLRNYVKFFVSGGIRTYEDVIKAIALGADGVIWGTTPLVAIGCDRNRNCHDGCSRGIATSNLIMQQLRNVELNSQQMINVFLIMQMQVIRALAALGFNDIRELRGRYDKIQWIGLKERVEFRIRQRQQLLPKATHVVESHVTGQSNCGVAAIIGTHPVPSFILDKTLSAMKNRGMDGVGIAKTLCFPNFPDHYAYRIMVKGQLQLEKETALASHYPNLSENEKRKLARNEIAQYRCRLMEKIYKVFLEPYFDVSGEIEPAKAREKYKQNEKGEERDYREFGNPNTDPGDIFCYFLRVKPQVLKKYIEEEILLSPRFTYIREYYPSLKSSNYHDHKNFLSKAEDLFVFNHSVLLTQILYVWDIESLSWQEFIKKNRAFREFLPILKRENPLSEENIDNFAEGYLYLLREFAQKFNFNQHKNKYRSRVRKIAAVMSCGKNFAVWKSAGREIPWETPASPNNIIHVRLATGSIVEQMNAHPFGKLHTALTHNGETTNYETLKQRVEQFGLSTLATTDTEVAALKFHLIAEELEYPDWALFESFSPTTGDDLALVPPETRHHLEEIQRVEFTSSPDGPYQYLCLRHSPHKNITERVDLKDPADLRPSTTAFWIQKKGGEKKAFSIIASEEQAIQQMLSLLDKEGLIDGAVADEVMVSPGMISRFKFRNQGQIESFEFIDRYGKFISLPDYGEHYSYYRQSLVAPPSASDLRTTLLDLIRNSDAQETFALKKWIRQNLVQWDFHTYRWVLHTMKQLVITNDHKFSVHHLIEIFTYFLDYLRTMDTGCKAKSSLVDITRSSLYEFFDQLSEFDPERWKKINKNSPSISEPTSDEQQHLLIDATGFAAEGTDPHHSLSSLLSEAYRKGWRRFYLYRVNGQRLISTAVMGEEDTDDVVMEVYGTPGEYFGAFMQGGIIRLHGNAQNFCAMAMHHGTLQVFGNAGKVCGYASKGGEVFILGNIVDRAWTNSVNDPRCQDLKIHILGTASKYAGESLMGGDFFFGGLAFDVQGNLVVQNRPYRGTKLLGGASRGHMLFFDPYNRLDPHQYIHGTLKTIETAEWEYWKQMVVNTLVLAGIEVFSKDGQESFTADGKLFQLHPENFKLIVPRGGLKGYESH